MTRGIKLAEDASPEVEARSYSEDLGFAAEGLSRPEDSRPVVDAAILVAAYTEQRLSALIEGVIAIREGTVLPAEIVVVIDHNRELVMKAQRHLSAVAPPVPLRIIHHNTGPRGCSAARNRGMASINQSFVVLLDDDAHPDPDWLERIVAPMSDPSIVVVGGRAVPAWSSQRPGWFPEEFDWVVGCSHRGLPEEPAEVRNAIGAAMAVRLDTARAVGGFEESAGRVGKLPLGAEETELCIKMTQLQDGNRVWYEPRAVVHHLVPEERASWRYYMSRCRAEGFSKAMMASRVGTDDGLKAERSHVAKTLPLAVGRGLKDASGGDVGGIGRAAAVVLGLASVAYGFLTGPLVRRLGVVKSPAAV